MTRRRDQARDRPRISKGLRYSIMQRDDYTCQYCGGRAPNVALQIDHVIPTSAGGNSEPDNLVTACIDCNAGKSATLGLRPITNDDLKRRLSAMRERCRMLRATAKAASTAISLRNERTWHVAGYWVRAFGGDKAELTMPTAFFTALGSLMDCTSADMLLSAIDTCACKYHGGYIQSEEKARHYFFAVIRNMRQEAKEMQDQPKELSDEARDTIPSEAR